LVNADVLYCLLDSGSRILGRVRKG
jgi:hypothetical protein